jgi:formate dehydrogenase major subunit
MSKQEPLSPRTAAMQSRLRGAEVTESVCPCGAIGCGLLVFAKVNQDRDHRGQCGEPGQRGSRLPEGHLSTEFPDARDGERQGEE